MVFGADYLVRDRRVKTDQSSLIEVVTMRILPWRLRRRGAEIAGVVMKEERPRLTPLS
jgi:hypothetical protein